jgi:hypothetical protein
VFPIRTSPHDQCTTAGQRRGETPEDRLLRIAAACEFGLVTIADAAGVGLDRFALAALVKAGKAVRQAPGLYQPTGWETAPWTSLAVAQRYLEGLALHKPGDGKLRGAATGVRALIHHGAPCAVDDPFLPLDPSLAEHLPTVAIPQQFTSRLTNAPFEVLRVDWTAQAPQRVRRIWVLPVADCLAHAAARPVSDAAVLGLVDRVRNSLRVDVPDLVRRWEALQTPGARRLLELEAAGHLEHESHAERRAFALLFQGRGPLPDCQVVVGDGRRVDFVFLGAGLIIEYLGREAHRDRWADDIARAEALRAAGWYVIQVTAEMLRDAAPLAQHIHDVRTRRRELIGRGAIPRPYIPPQPPRMRPLQSW